MKNSAIKTQNNQVMPAGSRLWSPEKIGGDLVYWLQPKGISAEVGTDLSTLNANRWMDSSFNRYALQGPDSQSVSAVLPFKFTTLGITFGATGKSFLTVDSKVSSGGGGGCFPDDDAPRIDPGTGAFTIITVCRLVKSASASVPYSGTKLTIAADGQSGSSSASNFVFQLKVNSNSSSDPSVLSIGVTCGTAAGIQHTIQSKSGNSQVFDENDFMFAYDRDGSGNAELFKDGASVATATGQNADMSDSGPRNIFCQVVFQTGSGSSGFIYGSDNAEHRIAETICFNNNDATTRILCEGYLAHKYGRQDTLPSTHKYRYGPPKV